MSRAGKGGRRRESFVSDGQGRVLHLHLHAGQLCMWVGGCLGLASGSLKMGIKTGNGFFVPSSRTRQGAGSFLPSRWWLSMVATWGACRPNVLPCCGVVRRERDLKGTGTQLISPNLTKRNQKGPGPSGVQHEVSSPRALSDEEDDVAKKWD